MQHTANSMARNVRQTRVISDAGPAGSLACLSRLARWLYRLGLGLGLGLDDLTRLEVRGREILYDASTVNFFCTGLGLHCTGLARWDGTGLGCSVARAPHGVSWRPSLTRIDIFPFDPSASFPIYTTAPSPPSQRQRSRPIHP